MGKGSQARRTYLVVIAAAVLVALVVQVALAGSATSAGGPEATSAGLGKQLKKLKGKVKRLQRQVDELARQPGPQGPAGPSTEAQCEGNPADVMVQVGSVCIDRYEASVWSSPTGGTQYGVSGDDYPCTNGGNNCVGVIFARSVPGVTPSRDITWFQAIQALANSGKRMATSAEWQTAVAGTPDPGADPSAEQCNTDTPGVDATGARASCVSDWGANDMIGNLREFVADWVPASTTCPGWGTFSDDDMCLSGASTTAEGPGALIRSGFWADRENGGRYFVRTNQPQVSGLSLGFRGAR